jgi:tetratricopeptide (TPR) repeat protein
MKAQTYFFLLVLIPIFIGSCNQQNQQSIVEEYTETMLTYPYHDTNSFPIIQNKNDIYPYSRIDGFSHTGTPRDWKVVKLENDYIEVYVLPEEGGKVWGAIDKVTGKEFIYKNNVVKYRDLAMRGPWTSGGIEFNTGVIGHHPGGASPVNYKVFTDDDGTAHCVVGGMDLPSHMQWRVDIFLPANTSYFETVSSWYNATSFYQPSYYWSNAAVKASKDLKFYFPGTHWIGHNGMSHPWPVDEQGVDRSWYINSKDIGSSSCHIFGSIDNYYVSYFHDEDFGSGHWSEIYGTPGKKIFLWSQARNGAIWENLLTDTNGQYVEVQAGRMYNQNSFSSSRTPFKQTDFTPYYSDSWTERWFPVRGTDGVTRVAESGTIHLKYSADGMNLLFSPIKEINAKLMVAVNGEEISNDQVVMKPSETLNEEFSGIKEGDKIEVYLGTEKLFSSEDNFEVERPNKSEGNALEDLFILAGELEQFRYYKRALETYLELIEKEPNNLKALERVAELYARSGEIDKALDYTRKVLKVDAYSPGTNFIYGNLQKIKGNLTDAKDGFNWSMRSLEYHAASLQLLAEISLMEDNPVVAQRYAEKSLAYNSLNLNAYKSLAIALRKLDKPQQAEEALAEILEIDPLDHFALFERYLLNPGVGLAAFNNSFQNEMANEEYFELGLYYANMGLKDEAIQVMEQVPSYPAIQYWLAWLNKEDQEKSKTYLALALEASPEFVFPYRNETGMVLDWASKQVPSWKTDYYSALILWNRGRDEEALALLEKWGEEPEFVPFYYSRACLKGINSDAGLEEMKRALAIGPDHWRLYKELANIYSQRNDLQAAVEIAEKGHQNFPGNYILDIGYSKALTNTGQYAKSLEVIINADVLPYEGERSAQRIFVYNCLMLAFDSYKKGDYETALEYIAKSETYPENLGSGSPPFPDYRNQNILRSRIYSKTGEREKAAKAKDEIQAYTEKHGEMRGGNIFDRGLTDTYVKPF